MFQYMRHASRIRRICLEANTKHVVLVIPRHMQVVRIGLVMGESHRGQVQLWDVLLFANGEAMELLTDARKAVKVGHSRGLPCRDT